MANSVIEEDLTIEGNVVSKQGRIDVKGKVVGDVTAEALVIQEGGTIDGALTAKVIEVEGRHKGSMKCEDLRFSQTSQVAADVTAQTMTTESGARIAGKLNITGEA